MITAAAALALGKTGGAVLWRYKWQLALVGALAWGGIEHGWRLGLQRDVAEAKVKAHEAIAAQQLKADGLADRLLRAQTPVLAAVTEKEIVYVDRINDRPATPADLACAESDDMRDANRAVRELFETGTGAGADGAAARRGPVDRVPAAAARPKP